MTPGLDTRLRAVDVRELVATWRFRRRSYGYRFLDDSPSGGKAFPVIARHRRDP